MPERRTKRRYAHELYPHPEEGESRPLDVEVRYWMARTLGLDINDTGWGEVEPRSIAAERINMMLVTAQTALLADALAQGLSGQEAWDYAAVRSHGEVMEWIGERSVHYGIDGFAIKPYPCGPEPDHHDHLDAPDARGLRYSHLIAGRESECPDCTEEVPDHA